MVHASYSRVMPAYWSPMWIVFTLAWVIAIAEQVTIQLRGQHIRSLKRQLSTYREADRADPQRLVERRTKRLAAEHKPDYRKIRELEDDLGLEHLYQDVPDTSFPIASKAEVSAARRAIARPAPYVLPAHWQSVPEVYWRSADVFDIPLAVARNGRWTTTITRAANCGSTNAPHICLELRRPLRCLSCGAQETPGYRELDLGNDHG